MSAIAAAQTDIPACHRACPDLACYSLNAEQKAKGLENLRKVRYSLGEKLVEPLRKQFRELEALSEHEDTPELTRMRLEVEMKQLENKANRIKERWS